MKNVHKNSIEVYNYLKEKKVLSGRRALVYQTIKEQGPLTVGELAEILDLKDNWVSGRVTELRDQYKVIEDKYNVPSPYNHKRPVKKVGVIEQRQQLEMFPKEEMFA